MIKPTRLRVKKIDAVAVVDSGASTGAEILIFKRAGDAIAGDRFSLPLAISKIDAERRIAAGWISVVVKADGTLPADKLGADGYLDIIDTPELIKAWSDALEQYAIDSREANLMHDKPGAGTLVELLICTPEKLEKLGIPQGTLPTAAYASFHFAECPTGDETWDGIKSGKYTMFSLQGSGDRMAYEKRVVEAPVPKRDDLLRVAPRLVAKMDEMAATYADLAGTAAAREELNEMVSTFMSAVYSILNDAAADKPALLAESASQFAAAVTVKTSQWFTKAGAKMSAARMEKFKSAMATLQDIMAEVEGMMADTKKSTDPTALEQRATDAEAKVATLTAENAELAKRVSELEAKVPKDDADILKGVPEPVRIRLEKAEADAKAALEKAATEEDKRITAEFVKRASDLITMACVPAKADEFGLVLKRIYQGKPTEADLTELDRVIKAMGEQIKAGALFAEQGRTGAATPGSAVAQVHALATELRKTKPTLTGAAARIEVRKSNPELAQRERAEQSH